ncbi:MAG TPA: hypothetical protein VNH44_18350 [Micropepsaceae bacterium]|nr:hypothetical protein [Micropepsaceae bacterium]
MQELVADRECGGCTVCCKHLEIDTPQLKKPSRVLCPHCHEAAGCGIYATRPSVCESWYCGWRKFPLGDSWRPDRCGILITLVNERSPSHYKKRVGLMFHMVDSPHRVFWEPCIAYMTWLIERRVPVFLSVLGAEGHANRVTFLNDGMAAAVAAHQDGWVARELQNVLGSCEIRPEGTAPPS